MNSIKKNFIYNIFYQILILFIPIITLPYVSRNLGVENIGIYAYHFSVSVVFGIFILLGNVNYGNRAIARISVGTKELISRTFWSIYVIQILFGLGILIIYILYSLFFSDDIKLSLIQGIYLISVILDVNWFFYGLEKFKITILRNFFIKIITLLSIFLLVKNENDIYIYAFILSFSSLLSQLVLWLFIRKYIYFIFPKFDNIIPHIRSTLLLFIPVIAVSLYVYVSKIILGNLGNLDEVGYFEYSSRLIAIPSMAIWSLGTVMFPRISSMIFSGEKDNIFKYIHISFLFSTFLSIPMSFGIIGIVNEFVPLFFGNNFDKCKILIPILISSSIFVSWAEVIRTQYLLPNRKDNIYVLSVIYAAVINIIINFLLTPSYGSVGAAIATLITEAFVCLYQVISIRNELNFSKYIKQSIFFVFIGFIMFLCILCIPKIYNDFFTILIKMSIGSFIYMCPCYIYFKNYLKKELCAL
ncbi:oligosaccharide flippase family protein [Gallibacterium anatis]|uniref:oligosaccharide flippase family protein n=1 Tax=Gallibacterium anatis TaxID=750 RepID=UPI003003FD7C